MTGHSGPAWVAGSGSSVTTAVRIASACSRSNGGWPSTAAYSDAPSPHRSPGAPDGPPRARSGAMYEGDPISMPAVVSVVVSAGRAMPKSVSTTRSSGPIRTFAGFTSRCAMPSACAARSAARIPRPTVAAWAGVSAPSSRTMSRSDRYGRSSITIHGWSSSSTMS